jgi:hypothetical protein
MTLGSTQPLTEMNTRNISRGKGGRCVGLTTLPPSCDNALKNPGASASWNPQSLSRPVIGLLYLYLYLSSLYEKLILLHHFLKFTFDLILNTVYQ